MPIVLKINGNWPVMCAVKLLPIILMKRANKKPKPSPCQKGEVASVTFGTLSPKDIESLSVVEITE